jgi:hypothetical protein
MKKFNKNNGLKFKRSFCTPAVLHGTKKNLYKRWTFCIAMVNKQSILGCSIMELLVMPGGYHGGTPEKF